MLTDVTSSSKVCLARGKAVFRRLWNFLGLVAFAPSPCGWVFWTEKGRDLLPPSVSPQN